MSVPQNFPLKRFTAHKHFKPDNALGLDSGAVSFLRFQFAPTQHFQNLKRICNRDPKVMKFALLKNP